MAKTSSKIAKRYAKALFELCTLADLDAAKQDLSLISDAWSKSSELKLAMTNPALAIQEREAALVAVMEKVVGKKEKLSNFLSLLLLNKRISALPEISVVFGELVDQIKKLLNLDVTSAFPLPEAERQRLFSKVQQEFGALATVNWNVNSEIIGGLVVRSGDKVLDSSVLGSLEQMRGALLS